MNNKLLVICGPTGVGKTALAVSVARQFEGELVSADSRQVYREMDIGTGKDRQDIGDVPIHLYDVVSPNEEFSVSQYVLLAHEAIADIQSRGKLPVVVGGTGFYVRALLEPFETINIPPNRKLRRDLEEMTVVQLQGMLKRGDMNDSDWRNPRRLIRKIEIHKTGPFEKPTKVAFDTRIVGLTAPIRIVEERISKRINKRLREGMKIEIATLMKKYGKNAPGMSAIGYRSPGTWAQDERAYAKRQMTYFRKLPGVSWFDVTGKDYQAEVTRFVSAWYTGRKS
jgi:tRNA dimethylallyltransferase